MLSAGAAAGSVMLRMSAVRTLYRALCRAGKCEKNPAEYVKSPKAEIAPVDAVMAQVVFPDQMVICLGKIADDYRGRRDRALLLVMYLLGLRVSEAAGLDWSDWKGDTLTFRAKGGLARELSVPEALKVALAALKEAGPGVAGTGPMVMGDGGRFTVRAIQAMVSVRLQAAGMAGRSPHALRHSCATAAAIGGSSPFAIQDQLGHASQRTTAIYTRVAGRFLEAPSLVVSRAMGI
jgi:site-specific recombinase XerC